MTSIKPPMAVSRSVNVRLSCDKPDDVLKVRATTAHKKGVELDEMPQGVLALLAQLQPLPAEALKLAIGPLSAGQQVVPKASGMAIATMAAARIDLGHQRTSGQHSSVAVSKTAAAVIQATSVPIAAATQVAIELGREVVTTPAPKYQAGVAPINAPITDKVGMIEASDKPLKKRVMPSPPDAFLLTEAQLWAAKPKNRLSVPTVDSAPLAKREKVETASVNVTSAVPARVSAQPVPAMVMPVLKQALPALQSVTPIAPAVVSLVQTLMVSRNERTTATAEPSLVTLSVSTAAPVLSAKEVNVELSARALDSDPSAAALETPTAFVSAMPMPDKSLRQPLAQLPATGAQPATQGSVKPEVISEKGPQNYLQVPFAKGESAAVITITKAAPDQFQPHQLVMRTDNVDVSGYLRDNLLQLDEPRWQLAEQQDREQGDSRRQDEREEEFEENAQSLFHAKREPA